MHEETSTTPSAGRVLERFAEIAHVDRHVDGVAAGAGSLLVFAGPAGIGKSTLLSLAADMARERGVRVLQGHGRPLEQEYAFGVALGIFEPLADRVELFEESAGLALPLLGPGKRDRLPEGDTFSIIHGLYWLTERLSAEHPVLVIVDDLQWVDSPSLRALAYLGERLGSLPVGVLAAVRTQPDGELPPEVDLIVRRVPDALRVDVPPLTPSAVESLAGSMVDPTPSQPALARACHQLTGGNPLLVVETLREIGESGVLPARPGASPEAVLVQSVRRRLDDLSVEARRLVEAAVVLGGAPVDLVAEVAELPLPVALGSLSELREAAFVEPDDPVRATHAIVGDVLASQLEERTRAALHRAAFAALDRRSAPPDVLAAHAAAGGPEGSARVVKVLVASARAAVRRGNPGHAMTLLERALAEPPREEARAEVLARLARSRALLGDPSWRRDLDAAVALDRAHEPQARQRVANALAGAGALRAAAEQYELGLRAVEDPTSEMALRLLAGLSQATLIDVTNERSVLERAEAALGPDPVGDTPARRDLLRHVAYARALSEGTRAEVLDLAHRSMRGDSFEEILNGPTVIAGVLAMLFADDEMLPELLDRAIDEARAVGRLGVVAGLSNYRGTCRLWRGDVDSAVADLSLARAGLPEAWAGVLPGVCCNLALAHLERGDVEAAENALELPNGGKDHEASASFNSWLWARSQVRDARGDLAGALADALECGRRERRIGSLNPATIPWEFTAGALLGRCGEGESARALVDEALERARRFGAPRTLGHGLRTAAGLVAGPAKEQLLTEATEVLAGTPWRLERTRTSLDLGRHLVASGRRRDGARHLREALDAAHDLGLVRLADQATEALRAAGGRPRRPRITGPESLTPTERVIADLAASGMTNREIAQHRFVTVKAVEFHLGNAYRKLGIQTRAGLSPALAPAERGSTGL